MTDLVIHEATDQQIQALINSPSHAMLLVGPKGSGKRSLADLLTQRITGIEKVSDYPYGTVIAPEEGKSIGIEAIRELEHFLSLKVPGQRPFDRFVILEDAHMLTQEAQNALLKTLEEPPQGSIILLTSSQEQALLPTIRSRVQTVKLNIPENGAVERYFTGQGYDAGAIKQAAAISGGLPGLMHTLLTQDEHPLTQATAYARQLLSKTAYERLLMVDELSKQKSLANDLCYILQQMAHVSLLKAEGAAAKRWQSILAASYEASEALSVSAQPKLVLSNLMLHL